MGELQSSVAKPMSGMARHPKGTSYPVVVDVLSGMLELELTQAHMTQKQLLRVEKGALNASG